MTYKVKKEKSLEKKKKVENCKQFFFVLEEQELTGGKLGCDGVPELT